MTTTQAQGQFHHLETKQDAIGERGGSLVSHTGACMEAADAGARVGLDALSRGLGQGLRN